MRGQDEVNVKGQPAHREYDHHHHHHLDDLRNKGGALVTVLDLDAVVEPSFIMVFLNIQKKRRRIF